MKLTLSIALVSLLTTMSAFAGIHNSTLAERHSDKIEKAIEKACGNFRYINELSTTKTLIQADQAQDAQFVTELEGVQRIDQTIFDEYKITVVSKYSDAYDFSSKDWGIYEVTSVNCQLQ